MKEAVSNAPTPTAQFSLDSTTQKGKTTTTTERFTFFFGYRYIKHGYVLVGKVKRILAGWDSEQRRATRRLAYAGPLTWGKQCDILRMVNREIILLLQVLLWRTGFRC
ncbi:hypothetical protein AVEN_264061-1 [Araneus ventricosus]|uniref:Uncharacterized protein n=1 Tax=Araneus ventricosus TaxID=182803 RepID=A0A4Y2VU74_ARAVE|nr:hypothetical protein AVEN_264061-1 [Araneus ventricosus]